MDSLKALSSRLVSVKYKCYVAYGNILDLLIEKVYYGTLTILAQYYDIHLCCFTFPDFQIAPTLEEFKKILNRPIRDHNSFTMMEEYFIVPKLASILDIDVNEVASNWASKGFVKGLTRKFLEGHVWKFAKEEKWESCLAVLPFFIYGIALFQTITISQIAQEQRSSYLEIQCRSSWKTFTILSALVMRRKLELSCVVLCCYTRG